MEIKPYQDGECRHDKRFDQNGILTCQECGATYNEETLTWDDEEE